MTVVPCLTTTSVNNVFGYRRVSIRDKIRRMFWLTTLDYPNKMIHIEIASADNAAADKFVISFARIVEEREYLPQ